MALQLSWCNTMGLRADYWRVVDFTYRAPGSLMDTIAANKLDPSLPSVIGRMGLFQSREHGRAVPVKPMDVIPFAFTISDPTGNLLEQVYAGVKRMSMFGLATDVFE